MGSGPHSRKFPAQIAVGSLAGSDRSGAPHLRQARTDGRRDQAFGAQGGTPPAASGAAALPVPRRVLLRSRLPVHVPRRRAGRAQLRRRRLASGVGRRAAPLLAVRRRRARRGRAPRRRGARRRPAAAAGLAGALPGRGAGRDAGRRPALPSSGRGAAFVLAATRLAFCGGFDLEDPEILAEAAAAAGVVLDDTLHAARDEGRDGAIEGAGRALLAAGADRLPALRIGRALLLGRGTRRRGARRRARVARRPERERPALGGDEPREDLRVERVDRLGLAHVAARSRRARRRRPAPLRRTAGRDRRRACRRSA